MNLLQGLESASLDEKLDALEALAISIARDKDSESEGPQWHRNVLSERLKKIASGEASWMSAKEAKERSMSKYRR